MDLTTRDFARDHGLFYQSDDAEAWPRIDAAMRAYAAQEAKAYAAWIANQPIRGRTYAKLWKDYEAEVLSQQNSL